MSESTAPESFQVGRLPMTEEELRILERNRRMTRRIMVPLMWAFGALGLGGGVWAIFTDALAVGIGLTFASITMLGFAWFFTMDTKKPVERPEKFFTTGTITGMKKTGSVFTQVYYRIELNDNRYRCFVSEPDFRRIKVGDVVTCERLEENSLFADRVVKSK